MISSDLKNVIRIFNYYFASAIPQIATIIYPHFFHKTNILLRIKF
jgi:hypothetical protein